MLKVNLDPNVSIINEMENIFQYSILSMVLLTLNSGFSSDMIISFWLSIPELNYDRTGLESWGRHKLLVRFGLLSVDSTGYVIYKHCIWKVFTYWMSCYKEKRIRLKRVSVGPCSDSDVFQCSIKKDTIVITLRLRSWGLAKKKTSEQVTRSKSNQVEFRTPRKTKW